MTKNEMVASIASKMGVEKKVVEEVLMFEHAFIKSAVNGGDTVHFRGFGVFHKKHYNARKGRNLTTGEMVDIPARDVIAFTPSKK